MIAYHSLQASSLPQILEHGLKCTSRGAKGDDSDIAKTDHFLDAHRPAKLVEARISRDNNLYTYVAVDDKIIDITDGSLIPISTFIHQTDDVILQITINEQKCYVSDIDLFDTIKKAIEDNKDEQTLQNLATQYWYSLRPLTAFNMGDIRRPEIMIPDDLSPANITIVNK